MAKMNRSKMKRHILAIIPARGGSKGIPRKNIKLLCGKPLISYSIEQALRSQRVTRIIVSTDDVEIAAVSRQYGAEVIMRPSELATDTASTEPVLLHVLEQLQQSEGYISDLVLLLQATAPLRLKGDIDNAIGQLIKEEADSLLSLTEAKEFIWTKSANGFTSLTFDYTNRKRRQEIEPVYYENGSIYIFKPEILKKYRNRLGSKIAVYLMEPWQRADIDDIDDFEKCEFLYRKYLSREAINIAPGEIKLIIYDFDGVMTDNRVILNESGLECVKVNRSDGLAVSRIKEMGIPQLILSTEDNKVVQKRAAKLGIPCLSGERDKKAALQEYLTKKGIDKDKVIFVGNDINDQAVMKYVGFPVAPNDAHVEIKNIARIVTVATGGSGVVRELLDILLNSDR